MAQEVRIADLSFLVVDEQVFQRNVLIQLLRDSNAKFVLSAPSTRDGLQMLKALPGPVDVVIVDLQISALDTLEFVRHVGAGRHATSVIVTSALERSVLACVDAMAAAYGVTLLGAAEKPITARRMGELLRHHAAAPDTSSRARSESASFTLEEIVDGLENGEFEPFFQPIVELSTWRMTGVEALARWRHPQQGIVLPSAFIGPLEETGRIHMLLRSILRQGAAFARGLREAGHECTLAVNLTLPSLLDLTLVEQIAGVAASQGLEPGSIILEIGESVATTDAGAALENLARLRMKGFGLAIDDYGRGMSSVEKLARVPFTQIKIDQPLLPRAERHESARLVFEASLDLARRLGMKAVAQGVETQAECDLLVQLQCDMVQGDYVAKPMARAACMTWLREFAHRSPDGSGLGAHEQRETFHGFPP